MVLKTSSVPRLMWVVAAADAWCYNRRHRWPLVTAFLSVKLRISLSDNLIKPWLYYFAEVIVVEYLMFNNCRLIISSLTTVCEVFQWLGSLDGMFSLVPSISVGWRILADLSKWFLVFSFHIFTQILWNIMLILPFSCIWVGSFQDQTILIAQ